MDATVGVTRSTREQATNTIPLALQLRGVLPTQCGGTIYQALAWERGRAIRERLHTGYVIHIIELVTAAADAKKTFG